VSKHTTVTHISFLLAMALSVDLQAASYLGTGAGPIPDGTSAACDVEGAPRVVSFAVSGIAANLTSVGAQFQADHTWVADIRATLAAPGGSPSLPLFGNTGGNPNGGDNSNLGGLYGFDDSFTRNWWTDAASVGDDDVIPVSSPTAGGFRTSAISTTATTTQTSLNAVFAGLTPAQANGTWTLTFTDDCAADTGSVQSATLWIDAPPPLPVSLQKFKVD
jgi:hypothetical protein